MKIYFVNDTSDNANWGCRATTQSLTSMLLDSGSYISSRLYLNRMQKKEEYIPSYLFRNADIKLRESKNLLRFGQRIVTRFSKKLIFPKWKKVAGYRDVVPEQFSDFEDYARDVLNDEILAQEKEALLSCDIVVINGEGSIYDQQRKGRMMLFIAYMAAKYFAKKCILVNHTADIHDPVMEEMVANVYPLLDDIVFREPLSYDACASHLPSYLQGDSDALAADVAFTYRPISRESLISVASRDDYFSVWPDSAKGFDPSKPYICVGGSSIYLRPDRPQYDPVPAFVELCRQLNDKIAPVVLTAPCSVDQKIFRPVAQQLNLPLIGLHTPTQQAVDILGNASVYISGRWHPSILALTGGTPIVTLTANTYKTRALLAQIGLDAPTFDALNLHSEIDNIISLTSHYISQGNELRNTLKARAKYLAELSHRNIQYVVKQYSQTQLHSKLSVL